MGKLTNGQRDFIAKRAADSKYPSSKYGHYLACEQAVIGLEVYEACLSKKLRDSLASVPDGWICTNSRVRFAFESNRVHEFYLNGDSLPCRQNSQMPLGIISGELATRADALIDRIGETRQKHKELETKVRALVGSVGTIRQLYNVWPEGQEFYAGMDNEPVALPCLNISEINAALGLPRETVKEAA